MDPPGSPTHYWGPGLLVGLLGGRLGGLLGGFVLCSRLLTGPPTIVSSGSSPGFVRQCKALLGRALRQALREDSPRWKFARTIILGLPRDWRQKGIPTQPGARSAGPAHKQKRTAACARFLFGFLTPPNFLTKSRFRSPCARREYVILQG
jgi:hypothetical protein